jgi:hypothetical protein
MGRHPQFSVAVDKEMRELLEEAACKNGCSLGEEIRRRIEQTLLDERFVAPPTRELITDIKEVARDIEATASIAWFRHIKSHLAFAEAVRVLIAQRTPPEPENWLQDSWSYYSPHDSPTDPATLGRTLARALSLRKQMGVSRPQFEAAMKGITRQPKVRGRRGRKKKS